jgi:esterase/lipase superfamily enzyme
VLAAAFVFAAAIVSGSIDQSNQALGEMGFDPDRSQLITALLLGAVAAGVSVLAGSRIEAATLLGCAGSAALFGPTFVRETQSATAATGAAGIFDLGGWLITVLALVVGGVVSGWSGAALATVARPTLADAIRTVGSGVRRRRVERRAALRAAWVSVVAVLLLVAVPVFGDIVNYTPDSHMLHGGPPLIGIGGANLTPPPTFDATPSPLPRATPSLSPSTSPSTSTSAEPSQEPTPTPTVSPSPRPADPHPWLAWRPAGNPTLLSTTLPGPWKTGNYAEITIVTPPGYSAKGTRRYPVLYEAPYAYSHWDEATNVSGAVSTFINDGRMPPFIVVAMSTAGGVFTDSECADSYDGREWFDTYVAQTVVPWIDSHYLTIATPAARAIMGASQGGYCSAALAVHHPDLFGTSLVFSGYFHAGGVGPPSNLPFGTSQAFIDAASPDVVIFDLPMEAKATLYYIVVAQLGQTLYGPEALRFAQLLNAAGIDHMVISSQVPHGWAQLRTEFGGALDAWAARMVAQGVF